MIEDKRCHKCGSTMDSCENCEIEICAECDPTFGEWKPTIDEVLLCPACHATIKADYDRLTDNGTKVCGTCRRFDDEDTDGFGVCRNDENADGEDHHCSEFCMDWAPGT